MMNARVLVVDDSGIARELQCFMLEDAGYDVQRAINGSEAMEKTLTTHFELVVTDVNMPQMDGYELTRRLRATAEYETTPIIIVSTESEAKDKTRGFEAGANLYVVKPVRLNDMVAKARMLLGATPVHKA